MLFVVPEFEDRGDRVVYIGSWLPVLVTMPSLYGASSNLSRTCAKTFCADIEKMCPLLRLLPGFIDKNLTVAIWLKYYQK